MISGRAWEEYPSSYRTREMAILGRWVQAGESGSVIGLKGSGKSNLLGFMTHRPQAVSSYANNDQSQLSCRMDCGGGCVIPWRVKALLKSKA